MARRISPPAPELRSWEDVDNCLRQIAECEIGIENLEADMNQKINDAKAEAEKLGKPLQTTISVLTDRIEAFAAERQDDLDGKSKYMNFGVVGYRKSTRVSYSSAKSEEIKEKLKKHGMFNCINVKETINKDALRLYSDKDLKKVGAKIITEDKFYCEADREKIR